MSSALRFNFLSDEQNNEIPMDGFKFSATATPNMKFDEESRLKNCRSRSSKRLRLDSEGLKQESDKVRQDKNMFYLCSACPEIRH